MTGEIHEGPLEPTPTPQAQKLTWREKRWERRRKRRMFEEVLGWILVPVILIGPVLGCESRTFGARHLAVRGHPGPEDIAPIAQKPCTSRS
jgi:hypothetical protein